MKHIKSFFSLAAIVLAAGMMFMACSDDEGGSGNGGTGTPVVKPQPGTDMRYTITDASSDIDFIELTSDMTYIVGTKGGQSLQTKAAAETGFVEGTYTIQDGTYFLEGWGTLVINTSESGEYTLEVTPEGSTETTTLTANYEKPVLTDGTSSKLCKSWTFGTYGIKMRVLLKKFDKEYTPEQVRNIPGDVREFLVDAVPTALRSYVEEMPLDDVIDEADLQDLPQKFTFTSYGTVIEQHEDGNEIDYWQWKDQKNGIIQIGDAEDFRDNDPTLFYVSYRNSQLCLTYVMPDMKESIGEDAPAALINLLETAFEVQGAMYFNPAR